MSQAVNSNIHTFSHLGATAPNRPRGWGFGTFLGGFPMQPARPISPRSAVKVHIHLQALIQRGTQAKVEKLLDLLPKAACCPQTRAAVSTWKTKFDQIEPSDDEGKALSLATLVIRVIRPAALFEEGPSFLMWEDRCSEILRQMGTKNVEGFLNWCDEALFEEKLMQDRCERVDGVASMHLSALQSQVTATDQSIESALDQTKVALRDHQAANRESHNKTQETLGNIKGDVEKLTTQLRTL